MRWLRFAALTFALIATPAAAQEDAQTILHLLDYIGVDYPEAVENGTVKNADEYKEVQEFTAQVSARIKALPDSAAREKLAAEAAALERLVQDKAAPPEVAAAAGKLRWALVGAVQRWKFVPAKRG
ncbi:MAG: hypothetical protein ACT4P4_06890 [Betaproteobacteria bacterium]